MSVLTTDFVKFTWEATVEYYPLIRFFPMHIDTIGDVNTYDGVDTFNGVDTFHNDVDTSDTTIRRSVVMLMIFGINFAFFRIDSFRFHISRSTDPIVLVHV